MPIYIRKLHLIASRLSMNTPTAFQVGPRVKHAREKLHITQDALAATLGFKDRQTISDIEKGKRSVKAEELLALSEALNQELEFFLDPFNVVAEAQYSWRVSDDLPDAELNHLEKSANGWIGMLRWLHQQEESSEPAYGFLGLRMNESSTNEQAQSFGARLGAVLGLGMVPGNKLPEYLETKLGIPVLFVDLSLGSQSLSSAGAACQIEGFRIILANRRTSVFQRNFDLACELFHALTWDAMPPSRRISNAVERRSKVKRVEQLAHNFAGALLMPGASLDHCIEPARAMDVQHLADVAEALQVTTTTLGWRLQALGRIDEPTRMKLADVCTHHNQQPPNLFSLDFVRKLHSALDKGRLSARKAAKTLSLSLAELTELFEAHGMQPPFDL